MFDDNTNESGDDGSIRFTGPTPDYVVTAAYGRDGRGNIFLNGKHVACSLSWETADYVAAQIERNL